MFGDTDNPARNTGFTYIGGSGSASIDFQYTVQSGDQDSNGINVAADSLRLNGGTIRHMTTHRDGFLNHAAPGNCESHTVDGSQAPTVLKLCDGANSEAVTVGSKAPAASPICQDWPPLVMSVALRCRRLERMLLA